MALALQLLMLAGLLTPKAAEARATAAQCGRIGGGQSGPWDYRSERWPEKERAWLAGMLANVEFNHFPPMTELLVKPRFRTFIDDIGYALERWPNHHRALVTVMRLSQRLNTERPENADRPVECWFERAARFAPDDPVVRGLYAEFLTQRKRTPEAVEQLQFLEKHAKDSAFTHYNIELLYLSIGRHEDALKHAHVASALGLTNIQGLRDKLAAQGHWRDPPDAASTGAAAAAGALPPAAAASSSP